MLFAQLYDKYFARLKYYAITFVKSNTEAEDIVQNMFMKFFEHPPTFQDEAQLRMYLYKCVKNRCINSLMSTTARSNRELSYTENIVEPKIVETELVAFVLRYMDALPVERQKIFRMMFFENMKVAKIAELLSLSVNTVKSQRAKSLISLRKELKLWKND